MTIRRFSVRSSSFYPAEIAADGDRPGRTVVRNVPVECGGVTVRLGLSSSPTRTAWWWRRRNAPPVLKEAQSIDARESGVFPFVRQFKSLEEVIKEFNRL